ncbi:hypothetical protein KGP39_07130 [Weissella hellenica]|nr:hypothetical protein [Weissella hellenica]
MDEYVVKRDIKNKNGIVVATMTGIFTGQGETPVIQTSGTGAPVGFNDDGSMRMIDDEADAIEKAQQEFMAELIAKNKALTTLNGGNPDDVNGGLE